MKKHKVQNLIINNENENILNGINSDYNCNKILLDASNSLLLSPQYFTPMQKSVQQQQQQQGIQFSANKVNQNGKKLNNNKTPLKVKKDIEQSNSVQQKKIIVSQKKYQEKRQRNKCEDDLLLLSSSNNGEFQQQQQNRQQEEDNEYQDGRQYNDREMKQFANIILENKDVISQYEKTIISQQEEIRQLKFDFQREMKEQKESFLKQQNQWVLIHKELVTEIAQLKNDILNYNQLFNNKKQNTQNKNINAKYLKDNSIQEQEDDKLNSYYQQNSSEYVMPNFADLVKQSTPQNHYSQKQQQQNQINNNNQNLYRNKKNVIEECFDKSNSTNFQYQNQQNMNYLNNNSGFSNSEYQKFEDVGYEQQRKQKNNNEIRNQMSQQSSYNYN